MIIIFICIFVIVFCTVFCTNSNGVGVGGGIANQSADASSKHIADYQSITIHDELVVYPRDTYHYTAIVLVIISFDGPYGALYRRFYEIIRTYDHRHPMYKFIYLVNNRNNEKPFLMYNDSILTVNADESIIPGIIIKYMAALKFVQKNYSFDFVVRTNLSSCLNLYKLDEYISTFPKKLLYAGHVQRVLYPVVFCSGPVTISADLIDVMLESYKRVDIRLKSDDVLMYDMISHVQGLEIREYNNMWFERETVVTEELCEQLKKSKDVVWIRVRNGDAFRIDVDVFIHSEFVKSVYGL